MMSKQGKRTISSAKKGSKKETKAEIVARNKANVEAGMPRARELAMKIGQLLSSIESNELLVRCANEKGLDIEFSKYNSHEYCAGADQAKDGTCAVVRVVLRSRQWHQHHAMLSLEEASQYLSLLERGCLRRPGFFMDKIDYNDAHRERITYSQMASFVPEDDKEAVDTWNEYASRSAKLLEDATKNAMYAAWACSKFASHSSAVSLLRSIGNVYTRLTKSWTDGER